MTGDDWLDRYAEDPQVAHLDRAIDWYEAEIAARPGEAPLWWPALGWTRQERATHTGDLADLDRAMELHRLVADALPPGDLDRDDELLSLAEARYGRFHLVEGSDVAATAAAIADLSHEIADQRRAAVARVLQGLILAEGDDPAATVAVLAPALDGLDPSVPYFPEGSTELCWAYAEVDELDRAIEAGRRAGESADPLLGYGLAITLERRWHLRGDVADRDEAIEHYRRLVAVADNDPDLLVSLGWLLLDRVEEADRPDAADEAIAHFERAAAAGEPCADYLALAHGWRWERGRDTKDLDAALDWTGRALREAADRSQLLMAHGFRLALGGERVERETAADPTRVPPSASDMRGWVDEATEAYADETADADDRARLAGEIAVGALRAWQGDFDGADTTWLREMAVAAQTRRDAEPRWHITMKCLAAFADGVDEMKSSGAEPGGAVDAMYAQLRADPELREVLGGLPRFFHTMRAFRLGDRGALRSALDQETDAMDDEDRLWLETMRLAGDARWGGSIDPEDLRDLLDRADNGSLSWAGRAGLLPFLRMLAGVSAVGTDGAYRPVDRSPVRDPAAADGALRGLLAPATAAVLRHDVPTMRECLDRLDELLTFFPAGHLLRLIATSLACLVGVALLRDEPGDQDAARRVPEWAGAGIETLGGEHHPRFPSYALARAEALRHLDGGDRAESRRQGLAGLRGYASQVLLQAGTDDAVVVAAAAGPVAQQVAGWCLADGAVDDLMAVLDIGRGLVLRAATAARTIADRLTAAGRHDLAERWRASAGRGGDAVTGHPLTGAASEVPDDLRATVLHALGETAPEPASAAEIRTALAATGTDALIYLLPSGTEQPGAAVVVPAHGEPAILTLPGLIASAGSAFDRLTDAVREAADRTGRDAGAAEGGEKPSDATEELSQWAQRAAMSAIRRHTDGWGLGRPARLVLVPTGPLSGVPWHAAGDDRGRFAVEDAVISYAISGRTFAESAREPVRDVKSALIVGDPTGELPFAGLEARAIARAFYPGQTSLGTDGTPQRVLDWIAAAAPGPSLLHLACHGYADPAHPADACLRLAGGELTARRLLDASRTAELEIEQVFLAACVTGAGGADHDEVFSLATAFLAAGARTVIGSLWPVPDAATSLLMFLVHHYRSVAGCAPVDALRRAQLWMLDPGRRAPAGMPAELARHASDPAVAEPRSWAAFVHRGR